jgi:KDO2-lipid IV(A) lauroyltransferase
LPSLSRERSDSQRVVPASADDEPPRPPPVSRVLAGIARARVARGVTGAPEGIGGWLARAIGLVPRHHLPRLGALIGWVAGTVLEIRRTHVERAMKLAGIARSRAGSIADMMYRSLGSSLVEMLWLAAHPELPASAMASFDEYSRAILATSAERGHGFVLATAHTGNWELAAAALAEVHPLTVIVKPMSVGWVDRFCRSSREARGVGLALPQNALAHAREAIARGEIVAMLIDQVPLRASHSVIVDFLCGRADVDRSPAALAAAMRCPMVVAVSRRREDGGQVLEVLAVLEPPERDRRAWAVEATRTATRVFERWVHAHPGEWLWMHRRWRAPPDARPGGARPRPGSSVTQPRLGDRGRGGSSGSPEVRSPAL